MLLVLTVERGALLQWQFGIGVHRYPGWPNTHRKPFEHSVLFLAAPLMPLQVLGAARALVLDSLAMDASLQHLVLVLQILLLKKRIRVSTKQCMFPR